MVKTSTIAGIGILGVAGYFLLSGSKQKTSGLSGGGGFLAFGSSPLTSKKDSSVADGVPVSINIEAENLSGSSIPIKKVTSLSPYTNLTSASPIGSTAPIFANGKQTGYEIITGHGGMSIPIKKQSKPSTSSFIKSIGLNLFKAGSLW